MSRHHETPANEAGVGSPTSRATTVSSLNSAAPVFDSAGAAAFSGVTVTADCCGIYVTYIGGLPQFGTVRLCSPGSRLQIGRIDAVLHSVTDEQIERERTLLRLQLLGEARDCWAKFYAHFAPTDTAALADMDPAPTICWKLADAAQEFERRAAAVRV